jgi:hypothetical protein
MDDHQCSYITKVKYIFFLILKKKKKKNPVLRNAEVEFIYIWRRLTDLERSLQLQVDRLDNVINGRCKASCCERIVQGTVVVRNT